MSRSARRLASTVPTDRFNWQLTAPPVAARMPIVFAESASHVRATSEPHHTVEARELHLPSVAAERLEAIEQQAFDDGYARGQQAGEAEAGHRLDATLEQFAASIAEVGSLRVGIMRRADRELIHLAIAMADRIIRREVKSEPELLLVMARVAIERLGERASAVVHLHPADHEAVLQAGAARGGSLDLVADPDIARGGCLIRSAVGVIDAGIDAQIRELSRALLDHDSSEEAPDGPIAGL